MKFATSEANVVSRRGLITAVGMVAVLAACGKDDRQKPRPLTGEEAEQLALVRFNLHQRGQVAVTMTWPGSPDALIDATVDLAEGLGFGTIHTKKTTGTPAVDRYIGWNRSAIVTGPLTSSGTLPERGEWSTRAVSTDVPQDIFLVLALTLGSDRPENPILLRQSSARLVRRDRVGDVPVAVIQGARPAGDERASRTRYWIDDDGDLRRFEAYLGDRRGRLAQITLRADREEQPGLRGEVESVLTGVSSS